MVSEEALQAARDDVHRQMKAEVDRMTREHAEAMRAAQVKFNLSVFVTFDSPLAIRHPTTLPPYHPATALFTIPLPYYPATHYK